MSPQEALNTLDTAAAKAEYSRLAHVQIQQASRVIQQLIDDDNARQEKAAAAAEAEKAKADVKK